MIFSPLSRRAAFPLVLKINTQGKTLIATSTLTEEKSLGLCQADDCDKHELCPTNGLSVAIFTAVRTAEQKKMNWKYSDTTRTI